MSATVPSLKSLVLDASVLIAALSPGEMRHQESLDFIKELRPRKVLLEEPAHFMLELYAVMNRTSESQRVLSKLGFTTPDSPLIAMTFVPLGEPEIERFLGWMSSALPGQSPTAGEIVKVSLLAQLQKYRCLLWVSKNFRHTRLRDAPPRSKGFHGTKLGTDLLANE